MPRYNTSYPVSTQNSAVSLSAPSIGAFTTLTGTAPYTVTLPDPTLFPGSHQSFWNSTSGIVTIASPSGTIRNAYTGDGNTFAMQPDTMISLASNGTDYLLYVTTGGPINAVSVTADSASVSGLTETGTLSITGNSVTASSSFTPSSNYDLMTKIFTETTYGKPWVVQSSNTTATAGARYFVNTGSVAITITLPASPAVGDEVHFIDYARTFDTRALTVANNGKLIMGVNDTLSVSTEGAAFSLVFSGNTYGWLITHGI